MGEGESGPSSREEEFVFSQVQKGPTGGGPEVPRPRAHWVQYLSMGIAALALFVAFSRFKSDHQRDLLQASMATIKAELKAELDTQLRQEVLEQLGDLAMFVCIQQCEADGGQYVYKHSLCDTQSQTVAPYRCNRKYRPEAPAPLGTSE